VRETPAGCTGSGATRKTPPDSETPDYPVVGANLGGAWRIGVQTDVLGENLAPVFIPNSPNAPTPSTLAPACFIYSYPRTLERTDDSSSRTMLCAHIVRAKSPARMRASAINRTSRTAAIVVREERLSGISAVRGC
jgi:hypothetical protein